MFEDPTLVITENTSTADLAEWDSVAMVQIVFAAEAEFGIRFTTEGVASIRSVADLIKLVENQAINK